MEYDCFVSSLWGNQRVISSTVWWILGMPSTGLDFRIRDMDAEIGTRFRFLPGLLNGLTISGIRESVTIIEISGTTFIYSTFEYLYVWTSKSLCRLMSTML